MNIGIRLHDTALGTFEERIKGVKDNGFGCGHLALYQMFKDISVDDGALTPGFAAYLKRVFEKNDVDIAVLGCYLNLGNPNKEQLSNIQHKYMAHLRFASLLGAGVVGTETGAPNETYTSVPECKTEEALKSFIQNLKPVVEYAEKTGVILAIEPVFRHIVWNPKCARRVLDEINSPNLGIIFDPVNLLGIENYKEQKQICREAIELLGDDIMMVHLKDFMPDDNKLISMAAGLGMMDYTDILKFIKEKKPHIHVTLEDTKPNNAVEAKEFLEKLYQEV